MIHFTNGSVVADALKAGGLPGRVVECADPLHDGPCLPGLTRAEWRRTRAAFLADGHALTARDVERDLEARDAAVDEAASADKVVLWFEHDLFDQLNLIWLVDALATSGVPIERVRLIVIGEHPEVPRFHGLGQLSPGQLLALLPHRQPLTIAACDEARAAWADVCRPEPALLARRAAVDSKAWPFLPGALRRLIEELPSVGAGLSRTERQGLDAVAAGASTAGDAFAACAAQEERVFLGDWGFYRILGRLQDVASPLVTASASLTGTPGAGATVSLTAFGRRVLACESDHATVNGLDRWVGGVRLSGRSPRWRVVMGVGGPTIADQAATPPA